MKVVRSLLECLGYSAAVQAGLCTLVHPVGWYLLNNLLTTNKLVVRLLAQGKASTSLSEEKAG